MIFAEEAYNLVVKPYDPVHREVQVAAGLLIDILITKGDFILPKDSLRLFMKKGGPSHPETVIDTSLLADTLRKLS